MAPIHTKYPAATYTRGSHCIDFIMGTPGIQEETVKAGYTSFYDGVWPLDYRGVFIDVSTDSLFHGITAAVSTPDQDMYPANIAHKLRFTKALERSNTMPDLLKELDQLMKIDDWNATHHLRFEQIDCRFTNELLSAENKCKHPMASHLTS
jgi:hypothetical protein